MIGNGTAIGKNAIELGEDTDARTLEEEEKRHSTLDELSYDTNTRAFIQNDMQGSFYQSPSY
ncbi:conserved hypothetical protein [Ricinus communis]|uniref:Uncharacterized protein n=1 Tax=Ricinus communis TaxID=3988 RepID=B9SJU6_RICCO|nr:conserved hypothetical protein [Ricinus communis]